MRLKKTTKASVRIDDNLLEIKAGYATLTNINLEYYINGSAVGIATGYGLDDLGVAVRVPVVKNFVFSKVFIPAVRPIQLATQWVTVILSLRVQWQGHKANHSSLNSAEVNKTWPYKPLLHTSS
jgi:hypothetical protein